MHPSNFFEECSIRTGLDVVEIFDNDLKEKLKNVHPKNFLKTKIEMPVYKVTISYQTKTGNYKEAEKYMVMDSKDADEFVDTWIDIFIRDYNDANPRHPMLNAEVKDFERLGDAVLPIG